MAISSSPTAKSHKSILIITSSGGGGLLQTAKAKYQEVRRNYPDAKVIQKDLLKEWIWKWVGHFFVWLWDKSQRMGNVGALSWFIDMQKYFDIIFWPRIFYKVLRCLLDEDVDRIIDTQPLGTSSIVKAIRVYNRLRNKHLVLEKVMVDLPTKKADHYYRDIKKLSTKDKKCLKVVTIEPLLEKDETPDQFWNLHCRLKDSDIQYEQCYIREGFHHYRNKPRPEGDFLLEVHFKSPEEQSLMQKTLQKGKIKANPGKNSMEFVIEKEDRLITLLLGSQPAYKSTYGYVKKITQLLGEIPGKGENTHLFVFCANHAPGTNSLYKKVHDHVLKIENYPPHLSIIPMSFQKEDVIAALFFRSDLTITKSGGQTFMELMTIMSGEVMVHSEIKASAKKKVSLTTEDLLKGIPGWEAGNARYLLEKRGAKIVTPEIFGDHFKAYLLKDR